MPPCVSYKHLISLNHTGKNRHAVQIIYSIIPLTRTQKFIQTNPMRTTSGYLLRSTTFSSWALFATNVKDSLAPKQPRPRSYRGIFVGYEDRQQVGYRIYLPEYKSFTVVGFHVDFSSEDNIFKEDQRQTVTDNQLESIIKTAYQPLYGGNTLHRPRRYNKSSSNTPYTFTTYRLLLQQLSTY